MTLIAQDVTTKFEEKISSKLLQTIYNASYSGFDYIRVAHLSPIFDTKTFFCYEESLEGILGTGSISYPTEDGVFPSEYYFGFQVPNQFRRQKLVELGKLAKRAKIPLSPAVNQLIFISILLAIKEYSEINNIDAWVATVHTHLRDDIRDRIGIPIVEMNAKVIENEITAAMGDYPKGVHFIYATMKESFKALEKFKPYIDQNIISIEINHPVST